jgi:SAM-dependent methyltransferase
MAELRETFDRVAEIYDRVRPTYPAALFEELFSHLPDSPEILEIGPGTGQATGSLLSHPAHVTAVELGPHLADFLKRKYVDRERLDVIVSAFEMVDLSGRQFDAIVSATAFHWVSQPFRLQKTFDLLRPGGSVAIIETVQVAATSDNGFFEHVQYIYDKYGEPADDAPSPIPELASSQFLDEFRESELYGTPTLTRYRWDQTYTTTSYIDLMQSYSSTQAMPELDRVALLTEMTDFIDEEFEGSVTRPLVITLMMAQTVS